MWFDAIRKHLEMLAALAGTVTLAAGCSPSPSRGDGRATGGSSPFAGQAASSAGNSQMSASGPRASGRDSRPSANAVVINDVALSAAQVRALEQQFGGLRIQPGRYWYDPMCGGWGLEGGPQVGYTLPGLRLGGPLQADASGGGTYVFVNGRELHPHDVAQLRMVLPMIAPGRYWLDGYGNMGDEGGPPVLNLVALVRQAAGMRQQRGGGAWSHHNGLLDTHMGGDGQGGFYYIDKDVSYSNF